MGKENALQDYITVNERIMMFYEAHPQGRIITEIVSLEDGTVIMKASTFRSLDEKEPSSTGFAYEKEGSSFINKTSYIENCETSATGRAIANLGIAIRKSIASKEEVENAKEQQSLLNDERTLPVPDIIKTKYKVGKGDLDGFEDWIATMQSRGNSYAQIENILTKKLMEKVAQNDK
jgi:hypothetical protein